MWGTRMFAARWASANGGLSTSLRSGQGDGSISLPNTPVDLTPLCLCFVCGALPHPTFPGESKGERFR